VTWSKDCFLPNTEFSALSFVEQPYHAVADLPPSERPLRRLREAGPGSVSVAELLACLLQTKHATHHAEELLVRFEGLPGIMNAR
jgi:DNA repair protein RadC